MSQIQNISFGFQGEPKGDFMFFRINEDGQVMEHIFNNVYVNKDNWTLKSKVMKVNNKFFTVESLYLIPDQDFYFVKKKVDKGVILNDNYYMLRRISKTNPLKILFSITPGALKINQPIVKGVNDIVGTLEKRYLGAENMVLINSASMTQFRLEMFKDEKMKSEDLSSIEGKKRLIQYIRNIVEVDNQFPAFHQILLRLMSFNDTLVKSAEIPTQISNQVEEELNKHSSKIILNIPEIQQFEKKKLRLKQLIFREKNIGKGPNVGKRKAKPIKFAKFKKGKKKTKVETEAEKEEREKKAQADKEEKEKQNEEEKQKISEEIEKLKTSIKDLEAIIKKKKDEFLDKDFKNMLKKFKDEIEQEVFNMTEKIVNLKPENILAPSVIDFFKSLDQNKENPIFLPYVTDYINLMKSNKEMIHSKYIIGEQMKNHIKDKMINFVFLVMNLKDFLKIQGYPQKFTDISDKFIKSMESKLIITREIRDALKLTNKFETFLTEFIDKKLRDALLPILKNFYKEVEEYFQFALEIFAKNSQKYLTPKMPNSSEFLTTGVPKYVFNVFGGYVSGPKGNFAPRYMVPLFFFTASWKSFQLKSPFKERNHIGVEIDSIDYFFPPTHKYLEDAGYKLNWGSELRYIVHTTFSFESFEQSMDDYSYFKERVSLFINGDKSYKNKLVQEKYKPRKYSGYGGGGYGGIGLGGLDAFFNSLQILSIIGAIVSVSRRNLILI